MISHRAGHVEQQHERARLALAVHAQKRRRGVVQVHLARAMRRTSITDPDGSVQ